MEDEPTLCELGTPLRSLREIIVGILNPSRINAGSRQARQEAAKTAKRRFPVECRSSFVTHHP
jgi:hypothetical protein